LAGLAGIQWWSLAHASGCERVVASVGQVVPGAGSLPVNVVLVNEF
jgi:hypothetical protein